jgi:hypothetical protein
VPERGSSSQRSRPGSRRQGSLARTAWQPTSRRWRASRSCQHPSWRCSAVVGLAVAPLQSGHGIDRSGWAVTVSGASAIGGGCPAKHPSTSSWWRRTNPLAGWAQVRCSTSSALAAPVAALDCRYAFVPHLASTIAGWPPLPWPLCSFGLYRPSRWSRGPAHTSLPRSVAQLWRSSHAMKRTSPAGSPRRHLHMAEAGVLSGALR